MIKKLIDNIVAKDAPIVVGLDPTLKFVPKAIQEKCFEEYGANLKGAAEAVWLFNKAIVDATYDLIPAVKPQIAMYEQFGVPPKPSQHKWSHSLCLPSASVARKGRCRKNSI